MKWFGPTFIIIAACTMCLFIIISIGGILQGKMISSPVLLSKGLTTSVPTMLFVDMISLELPHLERDSKSVITQKNVFESLFRFITDINPEDPRTILASEIPGMKYGRAVLLRAGSANVNTPPFDYVPPREVLDPILMPHTDIEHEQFFIDPSVKSIEPNSPKETKQTTEGKVKAFIYHSHPRESWLSELKEKGATEFKEAFDAHINVTLLGERLAERLVDQGIGAISSNIDYQTQIPAYNWNFSYSYSLKTIKEAFAVHPELEYFFDIHRDAQRRNLTTVTIDDTEYAQIFFIIGHKNPNWEKNEAFATKIHSLMEERYPGISRGIWSKSASSGHAEYNQSISGNSILIEIGGPENTLEESYRTIDILADTIVDVFWDAQRVDAPGELAQR